MKKNRKELIGLIISIILSTVFAALAVGAICQLSGESSAARIELDHLADRKARCDSVGGYFGGEKCYKNGEEMLFGGEE